MNIQLLSISIVLFLHQIVLLFMYKKTLLNSPRNVVQYVHSKVS